MSLSSALVASAIGALLRRPVITYNDYCRDPMLGVEELDMKAFRTNVAADSTTSATASQATHRTPTKLDSNLCQDTYRENYHSRHHFGRYD